MNTHYRSADGLSSVAVSAATPLPVTGGGTAGSPSASVTSVQGVSGGTPVAVSSAGYASSVSITRTADTTAYAANDVIGIDNAGAAGSAVLTFATMAGAAGEIMITSASLEIDRSDVPAGMTGYLLHLYSVSPPSALVDNNPHDLTAGDRASYLGFISLGSPADLGSTLYCEANGINKQVTLASTNLYGYLVTAGGYTPASGTVHRVKLHAVSP